MKETENELKKEKILAFVSEYVKSEALQNAVTEFIHSKTISAVNARFLGISDRYSLDVINRDIPDAFIERLQDTILKSPNRWVYLDDAVKTLQIRHSIVFSNRLLKVELKKHGFKFAVAGSKRKNAIYMPDVIETQHDKNEIVEASENIVVEGGLI